MTAPQLPGPDGESESAPDRLPFASGSLLGLLRLLGLLSLLGLAAAPVRAHGLASDGHGPVPFSIVVFLPVIAGIIGGIVAVRGPLRSPPGDSGPVLGRFLGFLALALAGTLLVAAVAVAPLLGMGTTVGTLIALCLAPRVVDGGALTDLHADLTLAGICAHRVFEGVAIAALYATGTALGTLGVLVVSGHTALETGLVGGMPGLSRRRAITGVGLVQVAYASGAGIGLVMGVAVPPVIRTVSLGALAGVLLVIGVREARGATAHAHATDQLLVQSTVGTPDSERPRS